MVGVGNDDVFVEKVPAGPARGVPAELADIDGIAEDIFYRAVFKPVAPVGADAQTVEFLGDGKETLAGKEAVEDAAHQLGLFFLRDQTAILYAVAEGGRALQLPPLGVDGHAALDLLAQADGVKFIHPLDDALNERAEGSGDQRLGDAHHVHAALGAEDGFIEDALLLVPGEAGVLPQQDHGEGTVLLLRRGDHPHEFRTALCLLAGNAGVNVDLVFQQEDALALGVLADLLQLGLRGKLRLVVGGDADVGRGEMGVGHGITSIQNNVRGCWCSSGPAAPARRTGRAPEERQERRIPAQGQERHRSPPPRHRHPGPRLF